MPQNHELLGAPVEQPDTLDDMIDSLLRADDTMAALRMIYNEDRGLVERLRDHVGSASGLARAIGLSGSSGERAVRILFTPRANADRIASAVAGADSALATDIHHLLSRSVNRDRPFTYAELSEKFDRSVSRVKVAVQTLKEAGIQVAEVVDDTSVTLPKVSPFPVEPVSIDFGQRSLLMGIVSDTHLGSMYAAEDLLHASYDRFAAEGVNFVVHAGDLASGPGMLGYPGHANDCRQDSMDWRGNEEYVSTTYPRIKGVITHCISSSKSHEGWAWKKYNGRDMIHDVANGVCMPPMEIAGESHPGFELKPREDLNYLGHDRRTIKVGPEEKTAIQIVHPDGGGTRVTSYKMELFVEKLESGSKPHILLMGHYHRFILGRFRNVLGIMVPCMQHATPLFMRSAAEPVLGAILLELRLDNGGGILSYKFDMLNHYLKPSYTHAE